MSPNEAVKLNQRQLPWVKCKRGRREETNQGRDDVGAGETQEYAVKYPAKCSRERKATFWIPTCLCCWKNTPTPTLSASVCICLLVREHLVKNTQKLSRKGGSLKKAAVPKEPRSQMKGINKKWHPRRKTERSLKCVSKLWIYCLSVAAAAPAHTHYVSVWLLFTQTPAASRLAALGASK